MDTHIGGPAGRVLLISPRFFDYERDIVGAIERRGFAVDFIDERPSNTAISKAVFRLRPKALGRSVDRYYRRLAGSVGDGLSLVLVIKGEVVPAWFIEEIKRRSPAAVFVFYTFDSLANSPHARSLMPLFDHRYSFQLEPTDSRFTLKHLFYASQFRAIGDAAPRRYELSFVGTLHSGRYRFVKRLEAEFSRTFSYFYSQARWFFELKRLTDARFRAVDRAEVHFEKLDRTAVAEVFRNSLAVLDMQHEQQQGLTMRSFEVIASGAYLVTTNAAAADTPLAATGRLIVVPAEASPAEIAELVQLLGAKPIPAGAPSGFERYSVDAWVQEFLEHARSAAP